MAAVTVAAAVAAAATGGGGSGRHGPPAPYNQASDAGWSGRHSGPDRYWPMTTHDQPARRRTAESMAWVAARPTGYKEFNTEVRR